MSIGRRLLWGVLLLTVVAALWPLPEDDTSVAVASRKSRARDSASVLDPSAAKPLGSLRPASPAGNNEITDLFPNQSFMPPAANVAPAPPTAPPLPFTYGGRYTEGSKVFVFLNEGAKMHTVRQGDTVNANYRIENIAPEAITLTYLPLGLQQTLQTGSTTPQ